MCIERLARDLIYRLHAARIVGESRATAKREWFIAWGGVSAELRGSAMLLAELANLLDGDTIVTVNNNIVGGDNMGNVGTGNKFDATNVSAFNKTVDASTNINSDLKALLTEASAALAEMQDGGAKKVAQANFALLTEELDKPEPDPSTLSLCWAGIKGFVAEAAPFVKLATALFGLYGAAFAAAPAP